LNFEIFLGFDSSVLRKTGGLKALVILKKWSSLLRKSEKIGDGAPHPKNEAGSKN